MLQAARMKKYSSIFLMSLFVFSMILPFASAVNETQYSDGSTTFSHIFTQSGAASTPGVTMPYGANVANAEFELEGTPSTTNWMNLTSDSDFGGAGQTGTGAYGWNINKGGWNYAYRQNVKVENGAMGLIPTTATSYWSMDNQNQISSSSGGSINTTGEYFSSAEAGYDGLSNESTLSLSGGSWGSYVGPVMEQDDEIHVIKYSGMSSYGGRGINQITRYNSTTNARIGIASISYNNCSSNNVYYLTDATSDGDGTVWMTSFYSSSTYGSITKWSVTTGSSAQYKCERSWAFNDVGGISIDPLTNDMYLVKRTYSSNTYAMTLMKVNRSSPTTSLQSWSLGIISPTGGQTTASSYVKPAGLVVQMPRISVNVYCYYYTYTYSYCDQDRLSWINIYHQGTNWPELQGEIPRDYATMGLEDIDGELAITCLYAASTAYCPSTINQKIIKRGHGAADWIGTPTSTSATITSSTKTITKPTNQLTISLAATWEPSGTSIDFEVSNDAGATWKRANSPGQTITFTNAGNQLAWRAWLNGTSSTAPIIDLIGISYTGTYNPTGQLRSYRYSSPYPVAATVSWNASTPGGSYLDVYFRTGSSSCTSGTRLNVAQSGDTVSLTYSGYLSICIDFYSGSNNAYSPTLNEINIATYTNVPKDVKIDIGGDGSYEWEYTGNLLGTVTANSGSGGSSLESAFNSYIPQTGSGTIIVPIKLFSSSQGQVEIKSMNIQYTMITVNLNISWEDDMVLHERLEPYEVVTRHVIGDNANTISSATLELLASPSNSAPVLTWNNDGTLIDTDPDDWIIPDPTSTWVNNSNGIMEIHWKFKVTSHFPEQENVGFKVSCTDDTGTTPMFLSTGGNTGIKVNQSYGLGWLKVRDNAGIVTHDDIENNEWIKSGEVIHFQGAIYYDGTTDAPLDSTFDVAVFKITSEGDFLQAKDRSNQYGEFFIPITVDSIDRPDGVLYEVRVDNPRDPLKVLPINSSWQRTIRVDATIPKLIDMKPADNSYEAAMENQEVIIRIEDEVGSPEKLELHYWVEFEHDANRNGLADAAEYVNQTMTNLTDDPDKLFFGYIDDSMNPNMAQVSYYVTGTDVAGNPILRFDGPGFDFDLVTYRTRKDMESVFTGLHWQGHEDGEKSFAGTNQYLSLGLVDANGLIDFTDISLIFDFEGPDPIRDQQTISFSGVNNSFWTDDSYLEILPACNNQDDDSCGAQVTTNETGMPWIIVTFGFQFSWDWPDADLSDIALEFTQLGSDGPRRIIFTEHTFRVENDLVIDSNSYIVEDVQEPRLGPVSDGSRVVPNDRLRWSGRIVYEGSEMPAPKNLGITMEVFDGIQYWSDGSLTDNGGFSIEVPLSAAPTLASSESRTFLAGVRNIPGRGEDMTRDTVSTTLQVHVDHAPPRALERLSPVDIIDISNQSALKEIPVTFLGWEDADLSGSPQWVHWLMRDENQRQISSGSSLLGMLQDQQSITWTGNVDIIGDGVNPPLQDYEIGFWIEGWDSAGNPLATEGNSKSDPVREPVELNQDNELQWVKFGALGAQLTIERISADREVIANGAEIEITAWIANVGGETNSEFTIAFYSGNSETPFSTQKLNGIAGESIPVSTTWKAEKGIDRIIVVADSNNNIIEVDESDNSASVGISVEYAWGMGWVENARQNMLAVIGIIIALIILPIVAFVSMKGAITGKSELFEDDYLFDDEYDDEYDDDEEYDDD